MFDVEARLVLCNERYREMYGLSPDAVKSGVSLLDLLERRKTEGNFSEDPAQYGCDLLATLAQGKTASYVTKVGTGREVLIVNKPMADGGWVATHEDISERRQIERQIEHMALHDALTDLPNRVLLRDRLEHALAAARRGEQMALLYLDLDQFKNVNDTLGHPVGDQLLKEVAARLRLCVREIDAVARIGGDEFAIIQAAVTEPTDAAALARRVREAITAPFDLDGSPNPGRYEHRNCYCAERWLTIRTSCSRAPTWHSMVPKQTDAARIASSNREMDARMQARRTLEGDLRRALRRTANSNLIISRSSISQSKQIYGFEALLRWKHPLRGLISPGEFIPVAEETGLDRADRGMGAQTGVQGGGALAEHRSESR